MSRRLAVVAGAGALAPELAHAAIGAGDAVLVLALSAGTYPRAAQVVPVDVGDPDAILTATRDFSASHLVFAGAVSLTDPIRRRWVTALGGGDDTADLALSRAATAIASLTGSVLLGAHQVVPGLLAPEGLISGPAATEQQLVAARAAFDAAIQVGRLDLGQAAVVSGQRLLAAEDVAGTDELLARIASYRDRGLVGGEGVPLALAKARKPGQPMFIDLPAIGASTVRYCAAAGISIIAVEAGQTLLLQRGDLREAALADGVSVVGLRPNG